MPAARPGPQGESGRDPGRDLSNSCYPDALIDCGSARAGRAVFTRAGGGLRGLSKSTGWIDQSPKQHDYDATPTVRTYVLISQDEPTAMVYSRDEDGRLDIQSAVLLEGADASIDIPAFGLALPFSAIYEGLELTSGRAAAS
jgi:hypothetical protein